MDRLEATGENMETHKHTDLTPRRSIAPLWHQLQDSAFSGVH